MRGIAETMLPDGTRRLTVTRSEGTSMRLLAHDADLRWAQLAARDGLTVRYVRCVETIWRGTSLRGGVFEAELEKA